MDYFGLRFTCVRNGTKEKKNTFPLCHILLNTLYRIYSQSTYYKNFVWVCVGDREVYLVRERSKTEFRELIEIKANACLILKFCLILFFLNYIANTWAFVQLNLRAQKTFFKLTKKLYSTWHVYQYL